VFFNLIARSNFRRQSAKRLQAHFRVTPDEPMEETIHLNERTTEVGRKSFFLHIEVDSGQSIYQCKVSLK